MTKQTVVDKALGDMHIWNQNSKGAVKWRWEETGRQAVTRAEGKIFQEAAGPGERSVSGVLEDGSFAEKKREAVDAGS